MSINLDEFNSTFNDFFNSATSKNAKRQFPKLTYKELYTDYPELFARGFDISTKNGIRCTAHTEEEWQKAKDILMKKYLPYILSINKNLKSYQTTNSYTTKSGEVHQYTSYILYSSVSGNKFKELEENEEVKKILKTNDKPIHKATRIKEEFPDLTKDLTQKQIYSWVYRKNNFAVDSDPPNGTTENETKTTQKKIPELIS